MTEGSELALLQEYCAIESPTLNVAGVERMQDLVGQRLEAFGFRVSRRAGEARFGSLLVAERPGRRPEFVSMITHSDTVLGNFQPFRVEGERGAGSGAIDNKGGLAVGLGALARFLAAKPTLELGLRFICSPNEEMGSVGFTDRFRELGRDTRIALGLEPALDDGSIIHQRRGNRWYDVEITGQPAHAGRSYGHHVNAAHDFAAKAVRLGRLINYRKGLSVNVGHVEGGQGRHNIICGAVHAKLDARFPSPEARDRLHRKIVAILEKPRERSVDGAVASVTRWRIVDDCPPFSLNARTKKLARFHVGVASRLEGRKIRSAPAGGAGDVNYLANDENFALDGLGPVGGGMHTVGEFIAVPTLTTRAQALAELLAFAQSV